MGITIFYCGSLADLSRVEDFEDRVIDFALAVGGNPRVWRSADEADPSRMVRGLILDLAPGQETTSLLISPEGWFIGPMDIEAAEKGKLTEPPHCWVKTQFGPVEGHVLLVELLAGIKKEFAPDLEVTDEGDYWETRNLARLKQKHEFLAKAIDSLTSTLENDHLSPEAREDADILAMRIERLAAKVHATLSRPAEHPPVHFPSDEAGVSSDPKEHESLWDKMFAENRRRQERMTRTMEEHTLRGEDAEVAFDAALRDAVPLFELGGECGDDVDDGMQAAGCGLAGDASSAGEEDETRPANEHLVSDIDSVDGDSDIGDDGDDEPFERMDGDPLKKRANDLVHALFDIAERSDQRSRNVDMLIRNAMEIIGGLAQALLLPPCYEVDDSERGLGLVQFKRALRGAAFVRGALFLVRADEAINEEEFRCFMEEVDGISEEIVELLRLLRET